MLCSLLFLPRKLGLAEVTGSLKPLAAMGVQQGDHLSVGVSSQEGSWWGTLASTHCQSVSAKYLL